MDKYVDLVPLFRREFELCNIQEGEIVGIISEPRTRPEYVNASAAAAASLGAEVFHVSVPGLGWTRVEGRSRNMTRSNGASVPAIIGESRLLPALRGALMEADFVLDLIPEMLMLMPFREELQAAGKRILSCTEPPDVIERMFPTQEIKEQVLAMRDALTTAKVMRVTSPFGTDLSYDIDGIRGLPQYGFSDTPGRWDNFPSGLANVWPRDGSGQGVQVLRPGDVLFPFKRFVHEEVVFVVENGYITSIEGGFDARLLREYLESWEDPEVYALAHASIGMHPRAQWTSLPFYDTNEFLGTEGRSVRGAVLFTTGPNRFIDPPREVSPHYDICVTGHTVYLDDEVVVQDGKVVLGAVPA